MYGQLCNLEFSYSILIVVVVVHRHLSVRGHPGTRPIVSKYLCCHEDMYGQLCDLDLSSLVVDVIVVVVHRHLYVRGHPGTPSL